MVLEQELATYQKNLEEWSDRQGKYVLIHESDVIDFFSAYKKHPPGATANAVIMLVTSSYL